MVDPPSSPATPKSNLPMMYYGLVVVAVAAIVLVLYNLFILRWCNHQIPPQRNHRRNRQPIWRVDNSIVSFVSTFNYKKDGKSQDDSECAVCLSVFEEGDEVRQLPKCSHYFHAPCIDMWLYSHMDCPLCRSTVEESEHSRQGLLGPAALV